jgi:uncharacterized protein YjbI with pentapeptide repeats
MLVPMHLDDTSQQTYTRTQSLNRKLCGRPFKFDLDLKGDEDFSGWDLRGVNFQKLNLSGVSFANADIRGANFANATLRNTNFANAKAGLKKRWMIAQLISIFLLSTILTFFSTLLNSISLVYLLSPDITGIARTSIGISVIVVSGGIYAAIALQGFTARAAGTTISVVAAAVAVASVGSNADSGAYVGAVAVANTGADAFTDAFTGAVVGAGAVAVAGAGAVVIPGAFAVAVVGTFSFAGAVVGALMGVGAFAGAFPFVSLLTNVLAVALTFSCAFAVSLLCLYVAWRTTKGDEKFVLVRNFGIFIGAIGGTSFFGADLTAANFSGATLKSVHFNSSKKKQTVLTHVCWSNAKQLDQAKIDGSILSDAVVLNLLVGGRGYQKNYMGANLYGANLDGKNLGAANLKGSNLSHALLRNTHLKDTNLSEVLATGTDFTGAYLTGACIEAWNIDAKTILKDVDCQHIFLMENHCERRPSSGHFAPGEFTKLFEEVLNTIDLIFQDGIDWKAFVTAFKTLQVQNSDTELTIQSIENKGDGVVVVRVNAPSEANKEKIHSEFTQQYAELELEYQVELKAKNEHMIALCREKYSDIREIALLLAQQDVIISNKVMINSQDQSRNFNNVNIAANNSIVNLGDISGSITNIIHQLQTSSQPNAAELSDRLQKLQFAVETESELNDDDKAEALEQVNTLAQAGQNPQDSTLKKAANTALKILKGTITALTPTAAIVKACNDLLPVITKLLGL